MRVYGYGTLSHPFYPSLGVAGHTLGFLGTIRVDITKKWLKYSFFEMHANGLAAAKRICVIMHFHVTLANPGCGGGGGGAFFGYFVHAAERSCVSEANKHWPRSRASLMALVHFWSSNMHSPAFLKPFLQKTYLHADTVCKPKLWLFLKM